jgi:CRISPR/Cas system CSM-associated protein Csm2 small subunit
MSYTRNFHETITVHGSSSKTVSYPKSESGGSITVTIDYVEKVPVDVNIHVDTDPFDDSVGHCNDNVNLLTGAVVATEAAQIASISQNATKVSNTVITGFFSYIRSEISQQIAELSQNIEAQVMHLKELAQACVGKKKQMEGDFYRISSRYIKIFDDLNNELSNRIFELDKPTFVFRNELEHQDFRTTKNDLVNTVTVFGKEGSELQSKISASIAKKRALDALYIAKVFLLKQKKLNKTIQLSMMNENVESKHYAPVCFFETIAEKSQINKEIYTPFYVEPFQTEKSKNELIECFLNASDSWGGISKEYSDNLKLYFNAELNKTYFSADERAVRVKNMIQKISKLGAIQTIKLHNI